MCRRTFNPILGIGVLAVLASCTVDPRRVPPLAVERLESLERELVAGWRGRVRDRTTGPFQPTGLYVDDEHLWVYSDQHRLQVGIDREGVRVGERMGPSGTRRCRPGGTPKRTICVGERQAAGLMVVDGPVWTVPLPRRAGFADMAWVGDAIVAVDQVPDGARFHLWIVRPETPPQRVSVPPGAERVIALRDEWVAVLGALPPYLALFNVGTGEHRTLDHPVPIRAADYDPSTDTLWVVGPSAGPVRRAQGEMTGLGAWARGLVLSRALVGKPASTEWANIGLDPVAVSAEAGQVAVALAGDDRVAVRTGSGLSVPLEDVLTPSAVARFADGLVTVGRLDDRVHYVGREGQHWTLSLDDSPRESLADAGERLFYGRGLWGGQVEYTCNSCHWDTDTDHRVHPGFLERRFEVTRPLGGIGQIVPVFSTGGASSLTRTIEGLIRSLDPRLWSELSEVFWEDSVPVRLKGGTVVLDAEQVREALLRFLMALPVPPGPLSGHDEGAGAAAFDQHCARCHRPQSLRPERENPPWPYGQRAYADTGTRPPVHAVGNRISPLWNLGRGGPYLVGGGSPTLWHLMARFSPTDISDPHRREPAADALPADVRRSIIRWLLGR